MEQGQQVKNGKTFEYAIAAEYASWLQSYGIDVCMIENAPLRTARDFFNGFAPEQQQRFIRAAANTIPTMVKLEPGLTADGGDNKIYITISPDSSGEGGDVRDIVISRKKPKWEIGFSAKNNNDAMKHSRLSAILDFGKKWVGVKCSENYWEEISPVFEILSDYKRQKLKWEDAGCDKENDVYVPVLNAFRKELLRINSENPGIPQKLIKYLIGNSPFYKIIKDDAHNLVIVKAFNIEGQLNKTVSGCRAHYSTPCINLPTRIIEFDFKQGSRTTLNMILDGGWEISFRIHSASSKVESSLKFDIKLLGNPPILFSQYIFQ